MTTRWLVERIDLLLGALAPLGQAQEEELARICAQEIAAWRARPSITKESTLRNPMTDTRNAIRERLEVTEANRWFNPQTQQYEHLALQYLNFTEEEWLRVMGDTQERFQRRLEEQQLLEQPDALVQQAEALFQMIHDAGHDNPLKYVREGISMQENLKAGAQKRQDQFQKKDFSHMPYAQLKDVRASAAADERIRRAILAIQKHNAHAQPVDRWYINAAVINGLIKTRFPIINAYLQEHQQDLDAHHQLLGIEPRYNRSKLVPVGEMIQIPELPDPEQPALPVSTHQD